MKRMKPTAKAYTGPTLEAGTPVRILRPNLWQSFEGHVVSVTNGAHRVMVTGHPSKCPPSPFQAEAKYAELEVR